MQEVKTMTFYDVRKDPEAPELVRQLTEREIKFADVLANYERAEPEKQLAIIGILEVTAKDVNSLFDLKRAAVNRLMAKLGIDGAL